ncbi:MAG: nucleoside triphosphate pyrophosphohydrolase [Gemmatimonadota bacterium]|nr:nucleoside triphosphate pyrophosphohydrolase [Gemmatimonadota bacterium]MDH5758369.1 nucleoside triphosphate pyrophosphohydrolase [Gemmatimonadota bacterium]
MSTNNPHSPTDGFHFPGPGVLDRALTLVRFLRAQCPWDAEQTPTSLIPHLLEEAHEVVDAIREGSPEGLASELGDLLLNVAFQVVLGEEEGRFGASQVYGALERKMIRRHPHLFGEAEEREGWETLKARERAGEEGVLSGLAKGLDPLTKAHRMQERVAGVGFDWEDYRGARDKVSEELAEVEGALSAGDAAAVEEELGDLLFAVVNLTRLTGVHSTTALDRANRKFHRRFEALEALARQRGISLEEAGLEVLDGLWEEVKAAQ